MADEFSGGIVSVMFDVKTTCLKMDDDIFIKLEALSVSQKRGENNRSLILRPNSQLCIP